MFTSSGSAISVDCIVKEWAIEFDQSALLTGESLPIIPRFTFISFLSLFLLKGNEFYFGLFDFNCVG